MCADNDQLIEPFNSGTNSAPKRDDHQDRAARIQLMWEKCFLLLFSTVSFPADTCTLRPLRSAAVGLNFLSHSISALNAVGLTGTLNLDFA